MEKERVRKRGEVSTRRDERYARRLGGSVSRLLVPESECSEVPSCKEGERGLGSRDNCLTGKGGRKLGMRGSNLQLSAVRGRFT